jgi:hypothetical protein
MKRNKKAELAALRRKVYAEAWRKFDEKVAADRGNR